MQYTSKYQLTHSYDLALTHIYSRHFLLHMSFVVLYDPMHSYHGTFRIYPQEDGFVHYIVIRGIHHDINRMQNIVTWGLS